LTLTQTHVALFIVGRHYLHEAGFYGWDKAQCKGQQQSVQGQQINWERLRQVFLKILCVGVCMYVCVQLSKYDRLYVCMYV
jgi:hypothetical protein